MSRIGNKPIEIPQGVTVSVANSVVTVKGPKGELTQEVNPDMIVEVEDAQVVVKRPTEQKRHKALHGLYRSLINNMVEGVSKGYTKELELVGVGYKAAVTNNVLELNLGYSHNIYLQVPAEVAASAKMEKGKNPIVTLESSDKELIGQVAAKLRSLRKIEPYKGKGVRFVGEQIRRKAGKTAAK
ncbi:LSU ribosomal protein L6P [Roseivirga pacifica]|uniref:Large ribosomal subunit protein uL6 n=1 Tax=Roseivirga pacifica TaxID=1267423 RepID=A0A1I0NZ53_9BACT|nr:50S ribosomal protein L6 [Roseivirga pacifica]MCO6360109.1 50S ribosomal protein L6 [Roseivirga pacifica]MCO6367480.1 50S ribosomal protein L6 [Roseivirga pacifica]MCO6369989.1 50S ribosomal protein L6 [Roseivirga pacifica]MCO6375136.1 50S ribosomal protein L6 [Roseivirga pacifica]MCO6380395.1 50S ribosomal protein L6 [Roseivirga pacifica]